MTFKISRKRKSDTSALAVALLVLAVLMMGASWVIASFNRYTPINSPIGHIVLSVFFGAIIPLCLSVVVQYRYSNKGN